MDVKEFQNKCSEIVKKIDNKYNVNRNVHLSYTQLLEEIGELAEQINLPKLRGENQDINEMKGEFADVYLQLCILADICGIDLESAVDYKIGILNKRHFS